jgi:hypothetical protein
MFRTKFVKEKYGTNFGHNFFYKKFRTNIKEKSEAKIEHNVFQKV